jgi:MoxR-like ATPase
MARIGEAAMEAALRHFYDQTRYQTKVSSAWDTLLTGMVFAAQGLRDPGTSETNDVVDQLFALDPSNEQGRLRPFRYGWSQVKSSGRKTVWNQASRPGRRTLASSLFVNDDIRQGLLPNARAILVAASPSKPSKEALTALLVRNEDFPDSATWTDAHKIAQDVLGLQPSEYDEITDGAVSLGSPMMATPEWSMAALPEFLQPVATTTIQTPPTALAMPGHQAPITMVIEKRTERMIRRAVARFPFILLVGPPGTGKGTLVAWVTEQVKSDPESFGFEPGFDPNPTWRTPDESWSAFDLIGGLAPDDKAALRWSPGALPNAIVENRWLVLDETNRADMDKIMGPLLTWLSLQSVEIGRDAAHGGKPVSLDWTDNPTSSVKDGTYSAGSAWRLFGTYNPADAQRVFRMGLALARRFVVVPVPALDAGSFTTLLSTKFPGLDQDLLDAISGLYAAHYSDPHTQLGPAIFLRMAEYVVDEDPSVNDPAELLAEAYVMNLGKYVAAYDDAVLDALGARLVDDGAISEDGWSWIKSHRNTLG